MNGSKGRWLSLVVVLLGGLIVPHGRAIASAPDQAQLAANVIVGTSTIGYSEDWEFSSIAPDQALFSHQTLPNTVFGFMDLADGPVPIPTNAILLETEVEGLFRSSPDVQRMHAEGSGTLPDGTQWQLYDLTVSGEARALLATGNTEVVPGQDLVTTLLTPAGNLYPGVVAAGRDITVNGQPSPYAGITMGDLLMAIGGSPATNGQVLPSTPADTSATAPTPTAAPVGSPFVTGTGQSISWAAPWAFDATRSSSGPEGDLVVLTAGDALMVVSTGTRAGADARTQAITLAGGDPAAVVTLDQGEGTIAYWFDLFAANGAPRGGFTIANTTVPGRTTVTTFVGPVNGFASGLSQAQASVAIEGTAVFEGVGGEGLQAQLEANAASLPAAGASSGVAAAETPAPALTQAPPEPTPTPAPDLAFADAGMVGQGHYISPQFGAEIIWDETWELDTVFADEPVASDWSEGVDEVHLTSLKSPTAWMAVFIVPASGVTMADIVAMDSDPRTVVSQFGTETEVMMSGSTADMGAVVYRDDSTFVPMVLYQEYHWVAGGTGVAVVRFGTVEPFLEEGIYAAQEHITFNGQPVLTFFPVDQVVSGMDAKPAHQSAPLASLTPVRAIARGRRTAW